MGRHLTVGDVTVEVDRKSVKYLRIVVYPPDGRVRVATPLRVSDAAVRREVSARLDWIRRQRNAFLLQRDRSAPALKDRAGETHLLWGRPLRLHVLHRAGRAELVRAGDDLVLFAPARTTIAARASVFERWYRRELRAALPALFARWQAVVGARIDDWRIRKMHSRWGSCNITDRRVWISLELAKKPPECLEYVVVHELTHLHERYHNERFWRLVGEALPGWRTAQDLLNAD